MWKLDRYREGISLLGSLCIHVGAFYCLMSGTAQPLRAPAVDTPGVLQVTLVSSDSLMSAEARRRPAADLSNPSQALAETDRPTSQPPRTAAAQSLIAVTPSMTGASRPASSDAHRAQPATGAASTPLQADPAPPNADWQAYRRKLQNHIIAYRQYPEAARRLNQQGQVNVWFRLDRKGEVLDVRVQTSSGVQALDAEAVASIQRAQPMPPLPQALPDTIAVVIPVNFGTSEGNGR